MFKKLICKMIGHEWKEFGRKDLNETGAHTAKRRCLRCGKIEDMGLCLDGGGSMALPLTILDELAPGESIEINSENIEDYCRHSP